VANECNTNATVKRNAMLIVRLPDEVKNAAMRAADDDHGRSLSGMVVRILEEWLTDRGYLKARPQAASRRKRA
jgi:hypothetical protein